MPTVVINQKNWVCYIVECNDKTLYTGITNNVEKRIATHNTGKGSKYVAKRLPCKLVFVSDYLGNRGHASKMERDVKALTKANKLKLIESKVNKHVSHQYHDIEGILQ